MAKKDLNVDVELRFEEDELTALEKDVNRMLSMDADERWKKYSEPKLKK